MGRLAVQNLSGAEIREISLWSQTEGATDDDVYCMLICRCLVDADGRRLYRTSEVTTGAFRDWSPEIVRGLGLTLVEFTGYLARGFDFRRVTDTKKN